MTEIELYEQALRWLGRREYGEMELRNRLRTLPEVSLELVNKVVERLLAMDYLSDVRFAEALVRDRTRRGQGSLRIRHELQQKGVPALIIESSLAELAPNDTAQENAHRALVKRFGPTPPEDLKARKKRHDFLTRRGFDGQTIRMVLEALG
ncbi:regulatory protein RecX [Magnetococcus marinus MC-1]|uniref:Regulatory protein RecX n=1 Tax=Magnetococcus marinus (strain ATCC BAA-1437 / JCM 17883 / MC-1) TaxID=156889 RepID=A0L3J8_MAGMM|nr:regulatory protein RecX [Magnetococcus marinus]ABK42541.1 regulatory protein RecX [Magnetococcus marinus MC-1]